MTMGDSESFPAFPLDRAVEQAIVSIKEGAYLLKCGQRGKPKLCLFRLSPDKAQATSWLVGLRAVISRPQHSRTLSSLRTRKGVQSCVNSPAGFFRRKKNLGLLEDTVDFAQVHSLHVSPNFSLSERCFSEGLSDASDSIYSSESFPYNSQSIMDIKVPGSAHVDPDFLNKNGSVYSDTEYEKNSSYRRLPRPSSPHVGNNNALKDVMVWGEEIVGGDNNVHSTLPKLLESTVMLDVKDIALGGKHAVLVTSQGEVFCWGQGKGGRLGHKIDIDISSPKIVDSLNGVHVKSVACGEYHTCALTDTGVVYTWGNDGGCTDSADCGKSRSQWIPHRLSGPLDGLRIFSIACGEWHTAIVSCCGRLFTCGDGTFGVLGHGNLQRISQPKEVESLQGKRVRSVACGSWHTAAIVELMSPRCKYSTSCKLFTWGDGDGGRLGHADNGRKLLPTCVTQLVDYDFVQVSCGRMLTVALTNLGKVFTIGSKVHGQLGNSHAKEKTATLVEGHLKQEFVKQISCGSYHVAVLTSSGSVYTWGEGTHGQLGLGDTKDRYSPSFVEALKDRQIESIACGSSFTAAICLHKPVSIADQSACSSCELPFGFRRKRHNCYNCGLLFCNSCSNNKVTNASLALSRNKAFRVCDRCFHKCQGIAHSSKVFKLQNYSSMQQLKHWSKFPDLTENGGETAGSPRSLSSFSQSCYMKSIPSGRKDWKNQQESQKHVENFSSLMGGVPQWGKVSCPDMFKTNYTENSFMHFSSLKNKLASSNPLRLESLISRIPNAEKDMPKSDKVLVEVQRLRAMVGKLEEKCKLQKSMLHEYQEKIEKSMSLAKEEAAKYRAAKEVIRVLTSKLQTISEKHEAIQEGKVAVVPYLSDVDTPRSYNLDIQSDSPILFSDKLRSKFGRSKFLQSGKSRENFQVTGVQQSQQDGNKGSNDEWKEEQYNPGVYITLTSLPSGEIGLKRLRFSRKRFSEQEAEQWWEENQARVCSDYGIEGFSNNSQTQV
ncbi:hypothetical protein QN277_018134 [Acacia crassicarpa]|uniref:Uncharacterized protein n=1 Tax=Acacia crassicarpa TaxID=499986 RepID=A0AAE1KIX5_9FABA|nr:hypothetical protein QN277_018134 [Acacia crassicarpa]